MNHDPLWYKKAIFYELNVRAFKDSNADGWGDLPGLISKLDYLKELGIDAIWLLPIMPSPLRDDGYDVSDYMGIFPAYGNVADFSHLIDEAHKRNLRVLVEIIPNHSSDQHYWFQASRDPSHPEHKKYKDWYVWSETGTEYKDARIIFTDTEKSNWTFDEKRGMYFWHRFFSSQPDLNYDNPEVQQAMLDVVRFWIDRGADGLRVDAPPYLFEREGTSCENLPETHAYLKRIRKFVDGYKPGVMLLSEANMWPEDVVQYFGDGDEMHMNFHFPLMPRLYMALAKGDITPIKETLARTPDLPTECQWGTFLRCHDELTLEMVTPEEREWMWSVYAAGPGEKLNMGIRRRLAPLMDGDVRKILLLHSLLLTMIGSPFLYYGDEIGMGDDLSLHDRNGLRTPMQWNTSKNAGFSDAGPEKLYSPVIKSKSYSYKKVNVAAQMADKGSLWHKVKHMLATRKLTEAFGLGNFIWKEFDQGVSVAAYTRSLGRNYVYVVNNLSDKPVKGRLTEEAPCYTDMLTGAQYKSGDLTLEPYQFLWLIADTAGANECLKGPNAKQALHLGPNKQLF